MLVTIRFLGHTHKLFIKNGEAVLDTGEVVSLAECTRQLEHLTDEFLRLDGWKKMRDGHQVRWPEWNANHETI